MEVSLTLCLPRDPRHVSTLRGIAESVLADVGAPPEVAEDVVLALSEACGNAVRHAEGADAYSVTLAADEEHFEAEVADLGPGFELSMGRAADGQESGRGIPMMRALVDDLRCDREGLRTCVRLARHWGAVSADGSPGDSGSHENVPDEAPPHEDVPHSDLHDDGLGRDGGQSHEDGPSLDGVSLRLLPWDAQRWAGESQWAASTGASNRLTGPSSGSYSLPEEPTSARSQASCSAATPRGTRKSAQPSSPLPQPAVPTGR